MKRNAHPKHVIAVTSSYFNPIGRFFWVQLQGGKRVVFLDFDGTIQPGNRIEIQTNSITSMTLLLDDEQVDPEKEITVVVNGKEVFRGKGTPSAKTALDAFCATRDPERIYTMSIPIHVP